jgi:hypothetical protein
MNAWLIGPFYLFPYFTYENCMLAFPNIWTMCVRAGTGNRLANYARSSLETRM